LILKKYHIFAAIALISACSSASKTTKAPEPTLEWRLMYGGRGDRGAQFEVRGFQSGQPSNTIALRAGHNPAVVLTYQPGTQTHTGGTLHGIDGFDVDQLHNNPPFYLLFNSGTKMDSLRLTSVTQLPALEHP
jgi:hypothetical protein